MTCLDTSCGVTFVNRHWLLKHLSGQKITIMSTPLKVRGISAFKHKSSELAALSLYFLWKNNIGKLVYALLHYEIHLVEGLCTNLFIGNDIISSEAIVINLGKKTALIRACEVIIDVSAKPWGQFLAKKLLRSQISVISPCSKAVIPLVKLLLPNNRDFLFYSTP